MGPDDQKETTGVAVLEKPDAQPATQAGGEGNLQGPPIKTAMGVAEPGPEGSQPQGPSPLNRAGMGEAAVNQAAQIMGIKQPDTGLKDATNVRPLFPDKGPDGPTTGAPAMPVAPAKKAA